MVEAIQSFHSLNVPDLALLNLALILLLPKKEEALRVADYRPISLINSVSKVTTKILAN